MTMPLEEYEKLRPTASIRLEDGAMHYFVPNTHAMWRVQTLLTKEPATIEWLNRMRPEHKLLDVGANVGMYTIYAARVRGAQVTAFEPESQNFALLNKNIIMNQLQKKARAFCAALSDARKLDLLYLSDFMWDGGSSCHSLGEEVGFDLKPRPSPFAQGCVSYTIDQAIEDGVMDVPDFIKIDVDGFEHKVIAGARKTMLDPRVRSLCIEINPALEPHRKLIEDLRQLGFYFDPIQVEGVTRKEGAFQGCAEYIFDRCRTEQVTVQPNALKSAQGVVAAGEHERAMEHVLAKVEACTVDTEPFPYVVLDDIFPADYYERIQALFPSHDQMVSLGETGRVTKGSYKERLVTLFEDEHFDKLGSEQREFWAGFSAWLYSERFIRAVVEKFLPWCANTLNALQDQHQRVLVRSDALLVSDQTDYAIGPHTDAAHRLVSFLFYTPQDRRHEALGTSLYKSKDPAFRCPGGPHYPFEGFDKQKTIGFIPNRLLMFVRTGRSFHGVETITVPGTDRRLIINNVRMMDVTSARQQQGVAVVQAAKSGQASVAPAGSRANSVLGLR